MATRSIEVHAVFRYPDGGAFAEGVAYVGDSYLTFSCLTCLLLTLTHDGQVPRLCLHSGVPVDGPSARLMAGLGVTRRFDSGCGGHGSHVQAEQLARKAHAAYWEPIRRMRGW